MTPGRKYNSAPRLGFSPKSVAKLSSIKTRFENNTFSRKTKNSSSPSSPLANAPGLIITSNGVWRFGNENDQTSSLCKIISSFSAKEEKENEENEEEEIPTLATANHLLKRRWNSELESRREQKRASYTLHANPGQPFFFQNYIPQLYFQLN